MTRVVILCGMTYERRLQLARDVAKKLGVKHSLHNYVVAGNISFEFLDPEARGVRPSALVGVMEVSRTLHLVSRYQPIVLLEEDVPMWALYETMGANRER